MRSVPARLPRRWERSVFNLLIFFPLLMWAMPSSPICKMCPLAVSRFRSVLLVSPLLSWAFVRHPRLRLLWIALSNVSLSSLHPSHIEIRGSPFAKIVPLLLIYCYCQVSNFMYDIVSISFSMNFSMYWFLELAFTEWRFQISNFSTHSYTERISVKTLKLKIPARA